MIITNAFVLSFVNARHITILINTKIINLFDEFELEFGRRLLDVIIASPAPSRRQTLGRSLWLASYNLRISNGFGIVFPVS